RGTAKIAGPHAFEITPRGVTVYPRLETLIGEAAPAPPPTRRSFNLPPLDQALGGGLSGDGTTLLLGSPGTGKTLLGTQFIAAGAQAGQPGLIWSASLPPAHLTRQAAGIGIDLAPLVEQGLVQIAYRPAFETLIDKEFA